MKLRLVISFFLVVLLLSVVIYFDASTFGKVVKIESEEIIDMKPDLVDSNLGTIVLWTKIDLRNKNEGIVEFFASRKVKGLWIRYRLTDKRLMGGLPVLVSASKNNFDGKRHMVAYTFKKGSGQALVFDGQIIAKGEYTGVEEKLPIGMVTAYLPKKVTIESVKTYSRILKIEEIKELYKIGD